MRTFARLILPLTAVLLAGCGVARDRGDEDVSLPRREGDGIRFDYQSVYIPPAFPVTRPFEDHEALKGVAVLTSDKMEVSIDRAAYRAGARVNVSVRYRDIPEGAGLKLALIRDVGSDIQNRFPGSTGPLEIQLKPVSGTGRHALTWTATETACAPTDYPMMCGPVTAGRYRIRATVYDRSDFLTVGWPPRPAPGTIAEADSPAFTVDAPPPLAEFERPMRAVALQYAMARVRTMGWRQVAERPLLVLSGAVTAGRDGVCADWIAQPPLSGRVRTCAPSDVAGPEGLRVWSDELRADGRVNWLRGVITYEDAVLRGVHLIRPAYADRIRADRGTELGTDVTEAAFKNDLGAWLIQVAMSEAGGPSNVGGRFSDLVTVCVNARSGTAHVLQTTGSRSLDRIDIQTWTGACPA